MKQKKLELTWIGKDEEIKLEPRILIEDPSKSYGDKNTENMLIHGDNLLALKALESEFTGKIKCIYIDPPYNTGNAFTQYDDNLEHSIWLSLMKPRVQMLHTLLSNEGSIWISIDDDEQAYMKVLCDEIFGRNNFVNNVIWEKKYSPQNDAKWLSDSHDFIMVYAKNKSIWRPNLLPRTEEANARYKNVDNDSRGPWKSSDLSVKTYSAKYDYPITTPSGRVVKPPQSRCWRCSKERFSELVSQNRIWFGPDGNSVPSIKRFLSEVKDGMTSKTIWFRSDVGDNQEAKAEINMLFDTFSFDTPKPERLLKQILILGSSPGDLVLDSFLGSGTTSAVAHKMGRKHIGIELFDHCYTHCAVRLKKVIDGDDGLELTKTLDWKGGGGFRYYELAPSLLNKDKHNNWVISKEYQPEMLAAAMAKQEGFKYHPDPDIYWKQGQSTEKDFIFTTTNFITVEMLDKIHEEMKSDESLLICCKSYKEACDGLYPNISIKKIPNMLLGRCEFGKDDYSLNIVNLPSFEEVVEPEEEPKKEAKKKKLPQDTLFPEK